MMSVWAISDLHLSFAHPDQRARYAERWRDHAERIEKNWRETVGPQDIVLMPGDISMARTHRDLQPDVEWIHRLPGIKVLAPGNHDHWWNQVETIRRILRPSIRAVDGNAIALEGAVICGAMGTAVPQEDVPSPRHHNVNDQLARINTALEQATKLRKSRETPLFVLWHFPPFDGHGRPGPWVSLFEQAQVTACVYGHLHTSSQWARTAQGVIRGVRYSCVAADAIGFRPLRIDRRSFDAQNPSPQNPGAPAPHRKR
jgi:predicted phosphohydrolase